MNGEKLVLGPEDIGMTPMQEKRLIIQRKPIEVICSCKKKEVIVLPSGSGLLLWKCYKCGQRWRFDYGPKGGQLAKVI